MFSPDDYTKNFENIFSKSPFKYDDVIKSSSEYNAKFAKIAFDNVRKNIELSQAWTKETLSGLESFTKSQSKPADYVKVTTDYITEQAQVSPKYLSEYAEIAKKTQLDTIELIMEVGKNAKNGMNKSAEKSASPKQKSSEPSVE